MNISSFLKKIKKQKQLKIVKPSEEIKEAYLETSESYFSSAKTLFKIGKSKEPTQLVYFSVYYSILALLFKIGIKCENHTSSIILLNEIFKVDNKDIAQVKEKRIKAQYYTDFQVTKNEVIDLSLKAENFREDLLDFISRLTDKDIKLYRNKFIKLIKL